MSALLLITFVFRVGSGYTDIYYLISNLPRRQDLLRLSPDVKSNSTGFPLILKGVMVKKKAIEVQGTVKEALSNAKFHIETENGHKIIAYPSGKMRKHFIKILPGDIVTVALSPYDLTNGR